MIDVVPRWGKSPPSASPLSNANKLAINGTRSSEALQNYIQLLRGDSDLREGDSDLREGDSDW